MGVSVGLGKWKGEITPTFYHLRVGLLAKVVYSRLHSRR